MALNPNTPLQVRNPEIRPMQNVGQLMQMHGQVADMAMRGVQLERQRALAADEQAEREQRQRDVADQNFIQEAYADPVTAKALGAGDWTPVQGKVQLKTLTWLLDQHKKQQEAASALTKQQREEYAANHARIESSINGLLALGDDDKIREALPLTFQNLQADGVLPKDAALPKIMGKDDLKRYAAQNGVLQGVLDASLKSELVKQQAATSKAQGEAAAALTEQRQLQNVGKMPLSLKEQAELEAAKNKPPTDTRTSDEKNYDRARQDGYKGTFIQWQTDEANRHKASSSISSDDDAKEAAHAIIEGKANPVLSNYSFRDRTKLAAELHRGGYDQATAERDWKAVQRHLSTLNGAQQERLRQAITFTADSLDNIESLYKEWKSVGPNSGIKVLNRAALSGAKQLPGRAGAVAANLEAQINDLTSELGTVYKGGNASTDESLRLAAANLKADWNEETFKTAVQQIRKNLSIRKNSILTSEPVGVSPNSPYTPNVGKIPIVSPKGVAGFIDASKWDAAEKRGFKKR